MDTEASFIDIDALRIGMFVHLDLGWMRHPFALNSFKIADAGQIATLRGLGLDRIRWSPEKSDPPPAPEQDADGKVGAGGTARRRAEAADPALAEALRLRRMELAAQRSSLEHCERQYASVGRAYRKLQDLVRQDPEGARTQAEQAVGAMVDTLLHQEESAIRLLSGTMGDKAAMHPVNVTVISLLLGKALAYDAEALTHLGTGALLHDIGKIGLPDRLRWSDPQLNRAERMLFQEHVAHGVATARAMQLPEPVLAVVAQHHETADGQGYPAGLAGDAQHVLARIVAMVNQYDNLCNPANPALALTPHESLAAMFAQMKRQFDAALMNQFIRMMGVYPPGSVVELNDGRFALVVSVNSSRPLKPRIMIHDARFPRDEAPIHDLECWAELGIRRSLKPQQLPRAAHDYLSPRQRTCYYFERARLIGDET